MSKRPLLVFSVVLFVLMLFFRYKLLSLSNGDLILIQKWYNFLAQHGIQGLADSTFSNYPPAYLYLLWFSTLFVKWINPTTAIKLIPTAFDLLSALLIFKIARTKYSDDKPLLFLRAFPPAAKMHDRYFYPADVFSFMAVTLVPEIWFIPILFQISSGAAY